MVDEGPGDKILEQFEAFTRAVSHLPLYHRLSEGISGDPEVRALLLSAQSGQARPVLLFAAVHDLLLRRPDLPAARWYPSITPASELATGDPYPAFRQACLDHEEELRQVIATRRTQTNEVNRCVLLAPLLAEACADVADTPVALVELGCSAGLLLGLDRYRIDVGGARMGDPRSPVHLAGDVVASHTAPPTAPFPPSPPIEERTGIDIDPVSLDDVDRLRWLEACLWPDEPARVERFRAAVDLMRRSPPSIVQGDLVDAVPGVVAGLPAATHLVVYHCWALTYVERGRRADLAGALAELAAAGRPVSWLSAEAPGVVPGVPAPPQPAGAAELQTETMLGLRRWRDGSELAALAPGWGHPHGAWLSWEL